MFGPAVVVRLVALVVVGRVVPRNNQAAAFRLPYVPVAVIVIVDDTERAEVKTEYHTLQDVDTASLFANMNQVLPDESETPETVLP